MNTVKNTKHFTSILFILSLLVIDQVSKWATQAYLPHMSTVPYVYPYGGIPVFSNILGIEASIAYATNKGAAWGMLSDFPLFLISIRIFLVLGMVGYLLYWNQNRSLFFPFLLVITGATGNIIDHFIYGYVVDMFNVVLWGYDYPVFNVADITIFCGVAWLIIYYLIYGDTEVKHDSSH
ncbi:MAG: signal peptidase II [Waddliaceae bacterium]|nr:signal peptidase II [Waddliaceae bacterium]